MSKLLFLCTGNYYRSRFAELLFNAMAATHALPWQAFSRGLALDKGVNNIGPMSPFALDALRALGITSAGAERSLCKSRSRICRLLITSLLCKKLSIKHISRNAIPPGSIT